MSDLKEVIARVRRYAEVHRAQDVVTVAQADLTRLLDAAEAAEKARDEKLWVLRTDAARFIKLGQRSARDAALEEAAKVADAWYEGNGWPNGAGSVAASIRSLKDRKSGWSCPMRGKTLERCGVRDHGNDIRTCTVGGCPHMPVAQGGAA